MTGWQTLFYKEVLRFWKVSFQTVAAPVLTAVLYLLIFGHVLEDHVKVYGQVSYTSFLVPGLVMMSVLQNSLRQQLLQPGAEQDHGQPGVPAADAAVALEPGSSPTWARRWCAGCWWAPGCVCGHPVFAPPAFCARRCGSLVFAVLGAAMLGALGLIAGCGPTSSTRWRPSRTSSSCR
jgi:ABC-2 type transport system permease protein